MNSLPSEQDKRIKYLINKGIMTDDQIIHLFQFLESKFNIFISRYKDISINMASIYVSNSFLTVLQKFKNDLANKNIFGGHHEHARSISTLSEDSKVLLLPTSVMLYSLENTSEEKILKVIESFKSKPFDLLIRIRNYFNWLLPDIDILRTIRNSEYHHSTLWDENNKKVTFINSNKPPIEINFKELQKIGINFSMAYLLLSNAQSNFFFIKTAPLLFKNIKGNQNKIIKLKEYFNQLNETKPNIEDKKILEIIDKFIQEDLQ